jgi:hypothetical protein
MRFSTVEFVAKIAHRRLRGRFVERLLLLLPAAASRSCC